MVGCWYKFPLLRRPVNLHLISFLACMVFMVVGGLCILHHGFEWAYFQTQAKGDSAKTHMKFSILGLIRSIFLYQDVGVAWEGRYSQMAQLSNASWLNNSVTFCTRRSYL